jgi:hypothetical protein
VWIRFSGSFTPAAFGKDILGRAAISAFSLPELSEQVLHASNGGRQPGVHDFSSPLSPCKRGSYFDDFGNRAAHLQLAQRNSPKKPVSTLRFLCT